METAAPSCFRRTCALAGLEPELWRQTQKHIIRDENNRDVRAKSETQCRVRSAIQFDHDFRKYTSTMAGRSKHGRHQSPKVNKHI